jgi:adenine C2-methylase RlmN of 23S rRNA A2503 and tRNA A37
LFNPFLDLSKVKKSPEKMYNDVKEILSHKHSACSVQYDQQNQLKVACAQLKKVSKSTELNSV